MATVPIRTQLLPRFFTPNPRVICSVVHSLKKKKVSVRVRDTELKESWLDSLCCPLQQPKLAINGNIKEIENESSLGKWVVGIDPDVSGALAVITDVDKEASTCSAQVFDTPYLQVMVGKKVRKRLDARSIVQLLRGFGAPPGSTAYIEQSNPLPQDGKQGWWSGGFSYGLWIGILISSGFSVVPISSRIWKDHFQLYRNSSSKDDSRKAASDLFPSLSSSLKRKKDHGRAEALLIAAYGKGLKIQPIPILSVGESSTEEHCQSKEEKPEDIEELL